MIYKTINTKIKINYTVPVDQNEQSESQLYKMVDAYAHLLKKKEISERVVFCILWKMVKNYE